MAPTRQQTWGRILQMPCGRMPHETNAAVSAPSPSSGHSVPGGGGGGIRFPAAALPTAPTPKTASRYAASQAPRFSSGQNFTPLRLPGPVLSAKALTQPRCPYFPPLGPLRGEHGAPRAAPRRGPRVRFSNKPRPKQGTRSPRRRPHRATLNHVDFEWPEENTEAAAGTGRTPISEDNRRAGAHLEHLQAAHPLRQAGRHVVLAEEAARLGELRLEAAHRAHPPRIRESSVGRAHQGRQSGLARPRVSVCMPRS